MTSELVAARTARSSGSHPFRRTFALVEGLVSLAAVGGTGMLLSGTYVPDVAAVEPIGLHSWTLPGLWLFATAAVPSGVAAWLAWRRHDLAPAAVLVASGLLILELIVQVPFLGPSPLQLVLGVPAIVLAGLALKARRAGWWHRR